MVAVAKGGDGGRLSDAAGIETLTEGVDAPCERFWRDRVADPDACQAIGLEKVLTTTTGRPAATASMEFG